MRIVLIVMITPFLLNSMNRVRSLTARTQRKKVSLKEMDGAIVPRYSTQSEPIILTPPIIEEHIMEEVSSSESQCEQKQEMFERKLTQLSLKLYQLSNENESFKKEYQCFKMRVYFGIGLLFSMNILALYGKLM